MRVVLVHGSAPRTVQEAELEVPQSSTVRQALEQANWQALIPEIECAVLTTSVWGRKAGLGHLLREGDRVEVVRPLRVDPKVARRERFVGQGARATGLFARRRPGSKAGY